MRILATWLCPSREPSSDPCFARATFSHKWENEELELPKDPHPSRLRRDIFSRQWQKEGAGLNLLP